MITFMGKNDKVIIISSSEKTYASHNRAIVYGRCKDPSPIKIKGLERWLARPFFNSRGGINYYVFDRMEMDY